MRFRIAEGAELEPAIEKVRATVDAHPRVLADPAPSVLLDRTLAENALEIVVVFSTTEDETAAVKSDLIKAVHGVLDTEPGTPAAAARGEPELTGAAHQRAA